MESLELLYSDTLFRLASLDWLGIVDLFLVAIVIFLMLTLVRRSQAALLLRGVLILGLLLLVITVLLPLPTFDWLVRGALLVTLVATPVILQPELRRMLARIGRTSGLAQAVRQTTAVETVLPRLLHSVEALAASRTGALIVLEANDSVQPVIDTGIPIESQITQELIQTIFYEKTPLHDGAVVLRGDRIVAASCVLPLTERNLLSYRRLGTRHRSAVGMSERSDALVIVVSEETGHVAIAHEGKLYQRLDSTTLRQMLFDFYSGRLTAVETLSLWRLFIQFLGMLWRQFTRPSLRQATNGLSLLLLTAVLTITIWSYVIEETNPTARPQIENIALRLEDIPGDMTIVGTPPATVSAVVRTTAEQQANLRADNFQAVVSLAGLEPGLHQLPVTVFSGVAPLQIVSVLPPTVNLELAPIITRTIAVSVDVSDKRDLSVAYEIAGLPLLSPKEAQVTGPQPLVEQVSQVQATLSVLNATTTIRELRPLRALDENGRVVNGVTIEPAQVQVVLVISRRSDARDVGVRAITIGSPPDGYWMSSLTATPASITLQGAPDKLAEINGFVDTFPVDVSQAEGNLTMQVPLDLPPDITAVDNAGAPVQMVTVTAHIEARTGDLLLTRPIKLVGERDDVTTKVTPDRVDLLLRGPIPILREIEANPELVQVVVDAAKLVPITGQSYEITPQITAPEGINVQLTPATVLVTLNR